MTSPTDAGRAQTRVSTTSGTHTVNLPASISAGDLLVCLNIWDGGPGAITMPSGWKVLGVGRGQLADAGLSVEYESLVPVNGGSLFNAYLLYRFADGSEGSTIVFDPTNSEASNSIVWRITGADPDFAPRLQAATGASTSPDPPNFEPGWGALDVLWIACMGADSGTGSVSGTPTGYSNAVGGTGAPESGGVGVRGATKQGSADLDEDPGAFTLGSSDQWVGVTVAIKGSDSDIDVSAHDPFDIDMMGGRSDNAEADDMTVFLPENKAVDDRAVIWAVFDAAGGAPTVTTPTGWTLVGSQSVTGLVCKVYERILDGTEGVITFATSPNEGWSFVVKLFRNSDVNIPAEVAFATGTSTSGDPPSITPSWGTSDFVAMAAVGVNVGSHNTASATPSGYEHVFLMPSASGYTGGVLAAAATKYCAAAASEDPATYTNPNNEWVAATIAIPSSGIGVGSRFQAQWIA